MIKKAEKLSRPRKEMETEKCRESRNNEKKSASGLKGVSKKG